MTSAETRTLLIICCTPSIQCYDQALASLQFGSKIKRIKPEKLPGEDDDKPFQIKKVKKDATFGQPVDPRLLAQSKSEALIQRKEREEFKKRLETKSKLPTEAIGRKSKKSSEPPAEQSPKKERLPPLNTGLTKERLQKFEAQKRAEKEKRENSLKDKKLVKDFS